MDKRRRRRTLEAIERELVNHGELADAPCWMAEFVERCELDPDDPFCRGLIAIDESVHEAERELIPALQLGRWPSTP